MIIRPLARFPKVPWRASPSTRPAAPMAASMGAMLTPSAERAIRKPMRTRPFSTLETTNCRRSAELPRTRLMARSATIPAILEIRNATTSVARAWSSSRPTAIPPSGLLSQAVKLVIAAFTPVMGGVATTELTYAFAVAPSPPFFSRAEMTMFTRSMSRPRCPRSRTACSLKRA